jgi:serine/threonine protein phosphatase 1
MTPIYAIGDIHGQIDEMNTALTRIEADGGAQAVIVFLGDAVDRGPRIAARSCRG